MELRPLRPGDRDPLQLLHQRLFPLNYDDTFYTAAVHRLDGVVSWAAAAPLPSLPLQQQHEGVQQLATPPGQPTELLAGFITARAFPALYADPADRRLLGLGGPALDRELLCYVLTLGVAEGFRRLGLARRLLGTVLAHAAATGCRAVYLHVAAFNHAAIAFYTRAGFRQLAVLPEFYNIRTGRQPVPGQALYDAHLFGCLVAPPAPTPWEAASLALAPLTAVIGSLNACLPWGEPRRKPHVHALEQAPEEQQRRRRQACGRSWLDSAPGGRYAPPAQQLSAGGAGGQPPDWLRSLFARR